MTWATFVGGVALFVWWFGRNLRTDENGMVDSQAHDLWAIYLGLGLVVGGRIFRLVDSYISAKDYNRRLRARLGLPEWGSVGVVPIRTDRAVTWGPSLTFRF